MKLSKLALALLTVTSGEAVYAATGGQLDVLRTIDQNQTGSATTCLIMTDSMDQSNTSKTLLPYVTALNLDTGKKQDIDVTADGRSLCIAGLDFGTKYEITLKKGIRSDSNNRLLSDRTVNITTIDHKETVSFLSGNIMSANTPDKKVAVESINMDKFQVTLYKISTADLNNYTSRATEEFEYKWDSLEYIKSHGKFVGTKEYTVKGKPNSKQLTMIDLKDFANSIGSGIYALMITSVDTEKCDASDECITKLLDDYKSIALVKSVVISDIGLTTYEKKKGIDIAVRSLSSAQPIANAKAVLVSASNEVLATVTTDANGYAHFSKEVTGGVNSQQPVLINVSNGADFYSQDLRLNSLTIENIETDYSQPASDFKVYAYTNRTMVRPGEKVYYEAIVRNAKTLKAADLKTLKLMIYRPDGLLFKEVSLSKPVSGGFDYEFSFDENAPLGSWRFVLGYDKKKTLSSTKVLVDNFIPSSIEPEIVLGKKFMSINDDVKVHTKFIYDAPAPDIDVSGYYEVVPDNYPVEKYSDYYFGPNQKDAQNLNFYNSLDGVRTDNSGNAFISLSDIKPEDFPRKVTLNINVTDPNSKILSKRKEFKLQYAQQMVGLKSGFKKDDPYSSDMGVIIADQSGKLYKGDVNYAIFKRNITYHFVYENGSWNYMRNEYLTPITSGSLKVNADTGARISHKFDDGRYVVKATVGDQTTSMDFDVGSISYIDTKYPDRFDLYTDKKTYKENDTAYFEFDSGYDGFADLMLDTDSTNNLYHFAVKKGHNKLPLKISGISNGCYAILSTYSANEHKYLGSRRAIGVAFIEMDKSDSILKVSAEIPDSVKPNSGVDIKVKVDNAENDTYITAALIDKGILSINNQKAPSPDKYIFNKKDFSARIYDPYSFIMKSVDRTGQGYGDEGEDLALGAPSLANITKNLMSYYTHKVKVENGYATIHYDLGDVSSTASFMVSAWSPNKLGSFSKDVPVKDSAVTRLNMPYYMHRGDVIDADLSVNNLSGRAGTYNYTVSCGGTLKCQASGNVQVNDGALSKVPVKVDALQVGGGYVDIAVKSGEYSFNTRREISVISPLSKVLESKIKFIDANKSVNVNFNNIYEDGAQVSAQFGKFPLSDISRLTNAILDDESIFTSIYKKSSQGLSILDVLLASETSKTADPKRINKMKKFINDNVSWVQSHIDSSGYINYDSFSYYKENYYATAYAALFLVEADKAGFNVNKSVLHLLKDSMIEHETDDSDNIAALSMYVLAKMGVNVKTNAIYKFDETFNKDKREIEAFSYYADIFGMYGDTARQKQALAMGIKTLNEVYEKYNIASNKVRLYDDINYFKSVLLHFPYGINNVSHEALALIRASFKAKSSDGLDKLFNYLSSNESYSDANNYLIIDISTNNKTPRSSAKYSLKNNTVTVSNSSSEPAVVTLSVNDYVTKETLYDGNVRLTQRFYDSKGKEIVGPVNLKVNEDVLVVNTFKFKNPFNGKVVMENKIPANTVLVDILDSRKIEKLYPTRLNAKEFGYANVNKSDVGFVSTQDVYNQNAVSVGYLIKGAHKGVSSPLMSSGYINRLGYKMYNAYNGSQSVIVK